MGESVRLLIDRLSLINVGDRLLLSSILIGDGEWTLDSLQELPRPMKDCSGILLENLLWSDPSDGDEQMMRGVHRNEARGENIVTFSGNLYCIVVLVSMFF